MMKTKLAWEVDVHGITGVVFATTAPKARWIAVKSYWDAGYGRQGEWPRPHARRVSALDNSPLKDRPAQCWVPEYAYSA